MCVGVGWGGGFCRLELWGAEEGEGGRGGGGRRDQMGRYQPGAWGSPGWVQSQLSQKERFSQQRSGGRRRISCSQFWGSGRWDSEGVAVSIRGLSIWSGGFRHLLSVWTSLWAILYIMDCLADFHLDWRLGQLASISPTLDVFLYRPRQKYSERLWTDSTLAMLF